MRVLIRVLGVLAPAGILVAGCGGSDRGTLTDPGTTTGVVASLTVRVIPDGGSAATGDAYTLSCGRSASGTLPDPGGACRRIAASPSALTATPVPGEVCTDIYGGPQVMEVTGTVGDNPGTVRFTRVNGCEIARYDAAAAVLFGADLPAGVSTTGAGRALEP